MKNPLVSRVMNTLSEYDISAEDMATLRSDAEDYISKGWTVQEVVSLLVNLEEVHPDLNEDVAIATMSRIRKSVGNRLATV